MRESCAAARRPRRPAARRGCGRAAPVASGAPPAGPRGAGRAGGAGASRARSRPRAARAARRGRSGCRGRTRDAGVSRSAARSSASGSSNRSGSRSAAPRIDDHRLAAADRLAAELDVHRRPPVQRPLDRPVVADQLLDGARQQRRIALDRRPLLGMREQRERRRSRSGSPSSRAPRRSGARPCSTAPPRRACRRRPRPRRAR